VTDTLRLASPRVSLSRFDVQFMNSWQDVVLPASIIYIWSSKLAADYIDFTYKTLDNIYLYGILGHE
jgi:hypothetical protein